jgi:hypothetical protein
LICLVFNSSSYTRQTHNYVYSTLLLSQISSTYSSRFKYDIVFQGFEESEPLWNAALWKQHILFYSESPQPPPPPPHTHTAKDVSYLLEQGQRNNVELQIKNSRRNIAFSVNSILPLQRSIYKDHKSISLWHETQKL